MDTITETATDIERDKLERLALFGQRVRELRGKRTIDELANVLGIHRNTLYRIEKGESEPVVSAIWRMAQVFGVSAAYLIGEDGGDASCETRPLKAKVVERGSYIYVPHFDAKGDATISLTWDGCVTAMLPFTREFIRKRLGIAHNRLALVNVPDRSMEPLLREGDTVLLETSDDVWLNADLALADGIYALDMSGALMIRRIQRLPGKVLSVRSESQDWLPFDINANSSGGINVLGRARWAGVLL